MAEVRHRIPRNVVIVAFVALASGFGQDLVASVLPGYLVLMGLARAEIGLIDGLLQGMTNLFRLVSGIFSDRFRNRKGFIFLGYLLSSVSRPLIALASTAWPVAGLRAVDGIGKGMKDAPRDALIADSVRGRDSGRLFGFHRLIDTTGSVLGPLVAAGLLILIGASAGTYRLIFALAAVPGLIALILIWLGVREPERSAAAPAAAARPLPWRFWIFTLGTTVAVLTKINDSLFLVRAGDVGIHRALIPVLFAGFTLVYALMSYPIGVWSDRIGKLPVLAAGWLVLAVVEFGFARLPGLDLALWLFALYGLFYALTEGSGRALIADLVESHSHGSAYAVFYAVTGVAVIVGGYGLGRIWDHVSPRAAFDLSAVGSLIGCLTLAGLAWSVRRRPSAEKI